MAVGDTVSGISSIASNALYTIQPGASIEWVIHNLYYAGGCEFQYTDGTNVITFDSDLTAGGRLGCVFHATNTRYLRIKNTSGSTALFAYDGVQTK